MIAPGCQRWREKRSTYRPAGETIDASRYDVALIADDKTARAFVQAHHYSASYPAARLRVGLYRGPELVGVAVLSQPVNNATLACLPVPVSEAADLGRFVLLDNVPANGETWFLARAAELARAEGIAAVVSFADPMPRTTADGGRIFPGHVGTIYQASNATYLGRARGDTLRLLPDGSVLHNRAVAKLRGRERGWQPIYERLRALGAAPLGEADDARAWVAREVPRLVRAVKHPGCHKYAIAFDRRVRRLLPSSAPYPKLRLEAGLLRDVAA